jgi:ATP-binding cassette subfamily F protein uup
MRVERSRRIEQQGKVKLDLNQAERSGKLVIEADNLSFGYTERLLVKDFSTTIMRGDKIGIIGPNGCGKSTMIKLLLGELQPGEGKVKQGTGWRRHILINYVISWTRKNLSAIMSLTGQI